MLGGGRRAGPAVAWHRKEGAATIAIHERERERASEREAERRRGEERSGEEERRGQERRVTEREGEATRPSPHDPL